jgi:hypothetical protein
MHPVLDAVQTLGSAARQPLQHGKEQLAPTVAAALDDGRSPLSQLFAEGAPLLFASDGLRLALLRTFTRLIQRRHADSASTGNAIDNTDDTDAALFAAYRSCVAWPVLGSSAAYGASHREVCACLHQLAERAGDSEVRGLQDRCVGSVDMLVQRLGAGLGEAEAGAEELCALGACELASELCLHGAWRDDFGRRLLPPLLRLLPLESAASIGLHGVADAMEDESGTAAESAPEEDVGADADAGDADDDEGSSVQSIALKIILRRIVDQAATSDLPFVANVLQETVRDLLPPAHGEIIHQYNAGGNQALGLSIGCSFHEMLFAQDVRASSEWRDIREDPAFWSLLRDCLLDLRMEVRSLALKLLRHAVVEDGEEGGREEGAKWAASPMRAAWEVFCMLYETLQQFAVHLLEGVWPQIQRLFDASEAGGIRGPKPTHPTLMANDWAAVLFRRGLSSENHAVQRLVLYSTLQGDVYAHDHTRVTDEVVFDGILPTCRGMWLYKQVTDDDTDSEVAPLLREFLSQHLAAAAARDTGAAKGFVGRIAEHLHKVPDTVTSRARMTLIGIMEHLRVPDTEVALVSDDSLRELRGIVVDQVPLEHSEAARDLILLASLSMACRFGAPPASQVDERVSFGAVSRLLLNYPVDLVSAQPACGMVAKLTTSLGVSWFLDGLKTMVSEYVAPTAGQRSTDAVKAFPVLLACASHFSEEAKMLYEATLTPAVTAVAVAHTHLYAPIGQAEAAIELLDAVLQQQRAPSLDVCLAKLIADECEGIAGYMGACIEGRLDALVHTGPLDPALKSARTASTPAALYAQFLVQCKSLLQGVDQDCAGRFDAVMQAVTLRATQVLTAGKQYSLVDGCAERNCARIDALTTLVIVSPLVPSEAASAVANLLTALLGVELEMQPEEEERVDVQQMTESDSEGYGRTWSERRNAFSRCKWDCICVLIRRIAPIGQASTGDVQFPTDDSAGLATALAAAIECSTDALDILSPAEGAAAASNMLIPIFEMLQHVLPWYIAQGDFAGEDAWEAKHRRLERILEPAWTAFDEVMKKTLPFLLTAITLFLPMSLWGDKGWHTAIPGSGRPSPMKRMYARLAIMGGPNRSTRVMSTLSLYCCRLWTKHPNVATLYVEEIATTCCYTNAHDESSKAHQHSAAMIRIGPENSPACEVEYPTVFAARKCQDTARLAARLFFEYLSQRADESQTADSMYYDLAVTFLRHLLALNQTQLYSNGSYAPGSDTWKLKIVLWQAIGVLIGCVRPNTPFALEVHNGLTNMMKRNDSPTVRQQADAAAVKLFLRCPELLDEPGWLPKTLANFKSPPQVAMSLMVIVGALLPRFTPELRSKMFLQLFNPMVTWINAGNRALRALSLVVVERLLSLAEQARIDQDSSSGFDCNGWPDVQQNVYFSALRKYLHGSPEGRAFAFKLGPYLDVFRPEELCSPHTVLHSSASGASSAESPPDEESDTATYAMRQFPVSVYELIKDSFKGMVMMVLEDEVPPPPPKPGEEALSAVEQLVAGSGSQVPWTPGALDAPLPDYVVRYQQRCLLAQEATAAEEAAQDLGAPTASVNTASGDDSGNDATVSFQRKINPNAAEIHPDAESVLTTAAVESAIATTQQVRHFVSLCSCGHTRTLCHVH